MKVELKVRADGALTPIYAESIATLESRRKEVLALQKKNEAEKLFSFMDTTGLTVDEIIAKLSIESVSA